MNVIDAIAQNLKLSQSRPSSLSAFRDYYGKAVLRLQEAANAEKGILSLKDDEGVICAVPVQDIQAALNGTKDSFVFDTLDYRENFTKTDDELLEMWYKQIGDTISYEAFFEYLSSTTDEKLNQADFITLVQSKLNGKMTNLASSLAKMISVSTSVNDVSTQFFEVSTKSEFIDNSSMLCNFDDYGGNLGMSVLDQLWEDMQGFLTGLVEGLKSLFTNITAALEKATNALMSLLQTIIPNLTQDYITYDSGDYFDVPICSFYVRCLNNWTIQLSGLNQYCPLTFGVGYAWHLDNNILNFDLFSRFNSDVVEFYFQNFNMRVFKQVVNGENRLYFYIYPLRSACFIDYQGKFRVSEVGLANNKDVAYAYVQSARAIGNELSKYPVWIPPSDTTNVVWSFTKNDDIFKWKDRLMTMIESFFSSTAVLEDISAFGTGSDVNLINSLSTPSNVDDLISKISYKNAAMSYQSAWGVNNVCSLFFRLFVFTCMITGNSIHSSQVSEGTSGWTENAYYNSSDIVTILDGTSNLFIPYSMYPSSKVYCHLQTTAERAKEWTSVIWGSLFAAATVAVTVTAFHFKKKLTASSLSLDTAIFNAGDDFLSAKTKEEKKAAAKKIRKLNKKKKITDAILGLNGGSFASSLTDMFSSSEITLETIAQLIRG